MTTLLLIAPACNNSTSSTEKSKDLHSANSNSISAGDTSIHPQFTGDSSSDMATKQDDAYAQNNSPDSMLSQLKGLTSMLGKNDSGILKNIGGGGDMDSMIKKMQSMMGGKGGSPGNVIGKQLLNLQLGQMKDDNPLKQVAKGMQQAQENGTAGPDKTYTAVFTPEQPDNFSMPVSGNGSVIMLQYSGGTSVNNKKDGLWKNVLINTNPAQWNVFTEGYMESSQINMKVHATSLASVHENYSINLNEQFKKYAKQYRTEVGKNEYNVVVQKIGAEKMFGYNCIHIKIIYTLKALGQTSHEQDDEWYSADVSGAQFVSPIIFENHAPAVVKKIMDTGCTGVLVKSVTKSPGSFSIMQLSAITKKDMPDSLFTVPPTYQEDKNTVLYDIQ